MQKVAKELLGMLSWPGIAARLAAAEAAVGPLSSESCMMGTAAVAAHALALIQLSTREGWTLCRFVPMQHLESCMVGDCSVQEQGPQLIV